MVARSRNQDSVSCCPFPMESHKDTDTFSSSNEVWQHMRNVLLHQASSQLWCPRFLLEVCYIDISITVTNLSHSVSCSPEQNQTFAINHIFSLSLSSSIGKALGIQTHWSGRIFQGQRPLREVSFSLKFGGFEHPRAADLILSFPCVFYYK